VHFAVVEKPGVAPLKFDAAMNQQEKLRAFELAGVRCSQEFFENATKTVRVDDVRLAMTALAGQPWASGFILVGHSEGTHVATGVLRTHLPRKCWRRRCSRAPVLLHSGVDTLQTVERATALSVPSTESECSRAPMTG
jgi:pimeloyl-ACP methyl ester carboxylesterase